MLDGSKMEAACVPSHIGRSLMRQRAELVALCARVRSMVGPDYVRLLDVIDERLFGRNVSVSVIGQVKAGKTSLLNAFMGKPGFLPADVNPWTAVVTSVNFGKPGAAPGSGQFRFFSDEEWGHFTRKDGRLREVVGAIPGNEDRLSEVEAEVEKMRNRARFRLGESFEALLGKSHTFQNVTPEILTRYICAGDDPDAVVRGPSAGRFADITREAEIDFDGGRFAFPLTLVDTPGLNDPLLIREEVTLRSLESSDIFVLVLTAHQAFSSADLYLLRILNAMRLDRLIIFINRIDELNDPADDLPEIRRHVNEMLRREKLPEDIPVISGSARWAEHALGFDAPVSLRHVETICAGFVPPADLEAARAVFGDEGRARAWAASGIPALDRAVDHMLNTGVGRTRIGKACVDVRNALQLIVMANDAELTLNRQRHAALAGGAGAGDGGGDGAMPDTAALRALVNDHAEKLQKEMLDSLTAAWARTRFGLRRIIKDFAEEQDALFAAHLTQTRKKGWSCDTTGLRRELSAFFRDEYPAVRETLRRRLERGVARIVGQLDEAGLKGAAEIQLNTVEFDDNMPVTTALARISSFDMEWSWWQGWLSRLQSHAKLRDELANMIRDQFFPIEEELMETAGRNLVSASKVAIRTFLALQEQLLNEIDRRWRIGAASVETDRGVLTQLIATQERVRQECETAATELARFERRAL